MFEVGQRVRCVDPCMELVRGRIYTVSGVGVYIDPKIPMLDVVGINAYSPMAFMQSRFRPLDNRKTNISIFTEMVNAGQLV